MKTYVEGERIYFSDDALNCLGETDYTEELWTIINSVSWTIRWKERDGEKIPAYLYSGKLKKFLHQVVIDYYFGEDVRKDAYSKNMIIEHLDNNGLNCKIENLYFLLDVKNKYKGNYYDKLRVKTIPVVALNIFHIIANHTFQITMVFNEFYENKEGQTIRTLKLLYDTEYKTVLQDAENILEDFISSSSFNMIELKEKYRFKDYHITFYDDLQLTDEEKNLPAGSVIRRSNKIYILKKSGEENFHKFHNLLTPFDEEWN